MGASKAVKFRTSADGIVTPGSDRAWVASGTPHGEGLIVRLSVAVDLSPDLRGGSEYIGPGGNVKTKLREGTESAPPVAGAPGSPRWERLLQQRLQILVAQRANEIAAQRPFALPLGRHVNHAGEHGALEGSTRGLQFDTQQSAIVDGMGHEQAHTARGQVHYLRGLRRGFRPANRLILGPHIAGKSHPGALIGGGVAL